MWNLRPLSITVWELKTWSLFPARGIFCLGGILTENIDLTERKSELLQIEESAIFFFILTDIIIFWK